MKHVGYIFLFLLSGLSSFSQYYLKGEIRDESNTPLANVKIILHSTGYTYYTGNAGGFGILSNLHSDSVSVSMDGFQPLVCKLENGKYISITMKMLSTGSLQKKRLISLTKDMKNDAKLNWSIGGETYSYLVENEFIPAGRFPETGFAINTDKASYSNVRRFINTNSNVPPDAVRTEEMLNYFNFGYTPPVHDSVFGFDSYLTGCPWNADNQLLILKVCATKVDLDKVPPANLVFLIDISGSMDMPNRLPLLKSAFKLMVNNLRDKDTISIVVYGSTVGIWLPPTSGKEKIKITKAIEDLYPGGATAGASGISTAYAVAKANFITGGSNRVILATDGDFNIGQTSEDELEKMISQHRQTGIYLTCLGVGMGNYKDSKLEVLAKKGNGNFAYLDDEKEAEKVLVKEFTQTLYTVADDAYLNIEFNPLFVNQYRLIGFDNKVNAVADSSSELEGGEVGSGHTLIAMIEISPIDKNLPADTSSKAGIANITVNFKDPSDSMRRRSVYICPYRYTPFKQLDKCYQFASSVVMFSSFLKKSKNVKTEYWNEAVKIANESFDDKDPLQKEFVEIIEKARRTYSKGRRRS